MSSRRLPDFVAPMLAKIGTPFDSDEHIFEVKWDGFRALAFVEDGAYRVLSRRRTDFTPRYPELDLVARLPDGTVVDGELVLLRDGRPDFEAMLRREQVRGDDRIAAAASGDPVAYVVFDLLYLDFESTMDRPLTERRAALQELVAGVGHPRLVLSEGVVGQGRAFLEQMRALGLEGVVAKRLSSRYEPGERSGAWTKIKPSHVAYCAILGWLADDWGEPRSLVIAINDEDGLRPVGKVGSGLTEAVRQELKPLLESKASDAPLIPCDEDARWVEPGLYCKVRYLERTRRGTLRGPVFLGLVTEDSPP